MKTLKITLVGLALALCIPLAAQDTNAVKGNNDVLELAKAKFSHEYPQTPDTEWKMAGDSYVVEFTTAEGENKKIWYDKSGHKQSEERLVNMEKGLPKAVKNAIDTKYDSYTVSDITEIKTDGNLTFRLNLNKDGEDSQVFLNSGGKEVKPEGD